MKYPGVKETGFPQEDSKQDFAANLRHCCWLIWLHSRVLGSE